MRLRSFAQSPLFFGLLAGIAIPAGGASADTSKAVFGGGCFWCVEEAFDKLDGVIETTSGYTGGDTDAPTYESVSAGGTGHVEVVEVAYDTDKLDYSDLLYVYWRNIDPFAVNRQFCDEGSPYRSALFPMNDDERALAESAKAELAERFGESIATEINNFDTFYAAEDYHQDYYSKNPVRYNFYKNACGRPDRLEEIWGDEAMPHESLAGP
ncbi:peptide-methionine (S)-S-oxide reductase MsrA [Halomonas sp. V046]|uniref:peptide-methionine (S)-S-oxide reductase MsrA n=1 Tax=Halomonas sp. V046 TaxID=3459611 RepID=UPI004043E891